MQGQFISDLNTMKQQYEANALVTCVVCCDAIPEEDIPGIARSACCSHRCHMTCINKWLDNYLYCPVCKKTWIDTGDLTGPQRMAASNIDGAIQLLKNASDPARRGKYDILDGAIDYMIKTQHRFSPQFLVRFGPYPSVHELKVIFNKNTALMVAAHKVTVANADCATDT